MRHAVSICWEGKRAGCEQEPFSHSELPPLLFMAAGSCNLPESTQIEIQGYGRQAIFDAGFYHELHSAWHMRYPAVGIWSKTLCFMKYQVGI